jgi:hypothetical protein
MPTPREIFNEALNAAKEEPAFKDKAASAQKQFEESISFQETKRDAASAQRTASTRQQIVSQRETNKLNRIKDQSPEAEIASRAGSLAVKAAKPSINAARSIKEAARLRIIAIKTAKRLSDTEREIEAIEAAKKSIEATEDKATAKLAARVLSTQQQKLIRLKKTVTNIDKIATTAETAANNLQKTATGLQRIAETAVDVSTAFTVGQINKTVSKLQVKPAEPPSKGFFQSIGEYISGAITRSVNKVKDLFMPKQSAEKLASIQPTIVKPKSDKDQTSTITPEQQKLANALLATPTVNPNNSLTPSAVPRQTKGKGSSRGV